MLNKTHQAINLTIETRMFVHHMVKCSFLLLLWFNKKIKIRTTHIMMLLPFHLPELQLQDHKLYTQLLTWIVLPSPFGRAEASVGREFLLLDRPPSLLGFLDTLPEVLGGVDLSGGRPRRIPCLACLSSSFSFSPSSLFYGEGKHKKYFFPQGSQDKYCFLNRLPLTFTFFFCFLFVPPLSIGHIIRSALTHSSYLL